MRYITTSLRFLACYVLASFFLNANGQSMQGSLQQAIATGLYKVQKEIHIDPYPNYGYWRYDKKEIIDKAQLQVMYDVDIIIDTLSSENKRGHDRVRTLISAKHILSHGFNFFCASMVQTTLWTKGEGVPVEKEYDWNLEDEKLINWFVYRDLETGEVENLHTLPLQNNLAIEYTEPQHRFIWNISEQTMQINGYECQKAHTDYAGRHWTVWFTPEIPIDCGLWKFSGLPGLIMMAEDSQGFYRFTFHSIDKTDHCIEKSTFIKIRAMDRAKFITYERGVFNAPLQYATLFNRGYMIGSHPLSSITRGDEKVIYTTETYSNTYFPMELE